ncbi:MAG: hypothetical protein NTZ02_01535 [Candidatus Woesearchaeota archaeon]|nr:hypothetical protein [Candidatus Woesearchaeota archaeon]
MQKKNLLIAADTFAPRIDGVSKFLQAVVPALASDFNITILAPDFGPGCSDLESTPGVRVVKFRIGKKQWGDFKLAIPAFSTSAHLMKKKVVIYTHVIEWQLALKNVGFRGIIKFFSRIIIMGLAKILYNWCTLIIAPSAEIAEIFSNHNIKVRKLIIPLGVDNSMFKPPRNRRAAKSELSINPDNIVIGYCGRLSKSRITGQAYSSRRRTPLTFPTSWRF